MQKRAYIPGASDINSAVVVTSADTGVLDNLAILGRRYGRKGFQAPLILTREHIRTSLDAFPVEFFDIKVQHKTIYGEDIFSALEIDRKFLRLQCEHDLKSRLINLRQGYIATSGHKNALRRLIIEAYSGFFPLLRAVLYLKGADPDLDKTALVQAVEKATGISMQCFTEIMGLRQNRKAPLNPNLAKDLFTQLYKVTDELSAQIDKLSA